MALNRTDRLSGTQPLQNRTAGTRPLAAPEPAAQAPKPGARMATDQIALQTGDFDLPAPDPSVVAQVAAGGLAVVTGSAAYNVLKNSLSVKKRVEAIQRLTDNIDLRASGPLKDRIVQGARTYAAHANAPGGAIKPLKGIDRVSEGIRVLSGAQSALRLKSSILALRDGATPRELANLASDSLNSMRGADALLKVARGLKVGFLPTKLMPGLSAAAGLADAVRRVDNLSNWGELSTKDKIANVAYLAADVADIAGAVPILFPFTKVISAGLSLVGMAAENWDTLKNVAGKAAGFAARAVQEPAEVAGEVADAVVDVGKKAVDAVKNVFSGW